MHFSSEPKIYTLLKNFYKLAKIQLRALIPLERITYKSTYYIFLEYSWFHLCDFH